MPVHTETAPHQPSAATPTVNYSVVIHGNADRAQLVVGSQHVIQNQTSEGEQIAPGFETVAQAVALTLQHLPSAGLTDEDRKDAEHAAQEILAEVVQPEPDRGKVRRAVAALRGWLAPLATGLSTEAGDGAHDWAKTAIEQLGTPF